MHFNSHWNANVRINWSMGGGGKAGLFREPTCFVSLQLIKRSHLFILLSKGCFIKGGGLLNFPGFCLIGFSLYGLFDGVSRLFWQINRRVYTFIWNRKVLISVLMLARYAYDLFLHMLLLNVTPYPYGYWIIYREIEI